MKELKNAPNGYRWIRCRFRKVRGNSGRVLDAYDYGYKFWQFLVRAAKK